MTGNRGGAGVSNAPPLVPAPPVVAALKGLCPACGSPTLFDGTIRFATKCPACGLDFDSFNVGDGPAAFLTLGLGAIVTVMALVVDAAFRPPYWVHALLWIPLTIGLIVVCLRIGKAALIGAEYRNAAHEGRIVPDDHDDATGPLTR